MIRMEIACFVILAFVAIIYFSAGIRTTRLYKTFSLLLITMLVHLIFDAITVYTVNRLDTVPLFLNDTLHRIYLGTMVLVVYLFFRYISLLVSEETGKKLKTARAAFVFLVLSELCVVFLPISYEMTPNGNYSGGIFAAVIYMNVVIYQMLCVGILIKNWRQIHPKKKFAIAVAMVIELSVSILQAINPTWLISGMGLTLMTLAFYLTLENPDILRGELNEQKLSMLYLKSQINPHFLYNTLDTIRIQAQLNGDKAVADMLMRLVDFFRLSIKVDAQMTTLDDELELIDAYMELMCYRYPDLTYSCNIDADLGECVVPNFILQPIIENSLLHGLKNKGYQGYVTVSAQRADDGYMEIAVSDTGGGFDAETKAKIEDMLLNASLREQKLEGSSIGILNVQKRIKLLCGRECGLWYTENKTAGVTAHILLKIER